MSYVCVLAVLTVLKKLLWEYRTKSDESLADMYWLTHTLEIATRSLEAFLFFRERKFPEVDDFWGFEKMGLFEIQIMVTCNPGVTTHPNFGS